MAFQKYTANEIHRKLIGATAKQREIDKTVSEDEDDWVSAQALFCPYYTALEGTLGGDWGVIVNPESFKFGKLVFEHEWCGCPMEPHESGEMVAVHGGGKQIADEWLDKRRQNARPTSTKPDKEANDD